MLPPGTRSRGAAATPTPGSQRGRGTAGERACVRAPAYAATAGRGARGHGGPAPGLGPALPGGTGSIPDSRTAREPGRSPDPAARSAAPLRAPAGARGGTALPGTEPSARPRSRRPVPKPTSSRRRPRLPWAPLAFSFTCAGPATGEQTDPGRERPPWVPERGVPGGRSGDGLRRPRAQQCRPWESLQQAVSVTKAKPTCGGSVACQESAGQLQSSGNSSRPGGNLLS
ncbi:translation initiation factor IF-2-like [Canis lupus dingo]|uniref:translation initiation factor IF-2-like n=1 Tax=Canis lupus dingo TaxID=286419 RepID=UPI000BAA2D8F|nr:translation initiation factor IF-2-like [Canis lupus dingo]|eukprot:XP_022265711.1 uncharacterized protein LOC102153058 [Canis lupus familiaris]